MVISGAQIRSAFGHCCGTLPLIMLWVSLGAVRAQAEMNVAQTGEYVVDAAGVIDTKTKTEIEGWLKELEEKTTAQVKVLTVKTDDGEDFFRFVQRHYDLWKLGKKGKSNGASDCAGGPGAQGPHPHRVRFGGRFARFLVRISVAERGAGVF